MGTVCHTQLSFATLGRKSLTATFDGGKITSDAGAPLLREIEERTGLIRALNSAIADPRDLRKIRHAQLTLLRQRIYAIALSYENANDHNTLRSDPAIKIATGHTPDSDPDLASQPTISRLENRISRRQLVRLPRVLLESYIAAHPGARRHIVLDIDSTDNPALGRQQLALFHGFYKQYMFHPLVVFDGLTDYPLGAVLRFRPRPHPRARQRRLCHVDPLSIAALPLASTGNSCAPSWPTSPVFWHNRSRHGPIPLTGSTLNAGGAAHGSGERADVCMGLQKRPASPPDYTGPQPRNTKVSPSSTPHALAGYGQFGLNYFENNAL
ncbi:Transposase DDE domain group 1 [Desulfacinum hydrothermale DSM 13146]|uniref:Transposase DDE domain group 1 n=1 Tax=Desulfacinum hydrothermale DSM 13146 TaxID=1121390 RepID=A0A1W1XSH3_9BACT|nr:Transposase DDE domain group 1 [Desulfacinum hydrothermale DSM 13146]